MQNENESQHDLSEPKTQAEQLNQRTREIGYQRGEESGQGQAPAREEKDDTGPSNSGDAGYGSAGSPLQEVSEDRMEQMSHADGSFEEDHNPDV